MSFSKVATFVAFLAFISTASAHGFVKDIIVLGENKKYVAARLRGSDRRHF